LLEKLFKTDPNSVGQLDKAGRPTNFGENQVCPDCLRSYSKKDLKAIKNSSSSATTMNICADHIMSFHWSQLSEERFHNAYQETLLNQFKPVQIKDAFKKINAAQFLPPTWDKSSILPLISDQTVDDLAQNSSGLLSINFRRYSRQADQFCFLNVLVLGTLLQDGNFTIPKKEKKEKQAFKTLKEDLEGKIVKFQSFIS
jgi:hypothetical protein